MGAVVLQTAGWMICDTAAAGGGLALRTLPQRALTSRRDATIVMTKR
jgi:hypothetical protein